MKKQTLIKYAACIGMACSMTACDDWLGNQPKGEMIPETLNDYQMLLNSQYLYNSLDVYPLFLTDDIRLTGRGEIVNESGDFTDFDYLGKSEEMRNAYSFANGDLFLPGDADPIWNDGYEHIFTYNAIINNVLNTTDG